MDRKWGSTFALRTLATLSLLIALGCLGGGTTGTSEAPEVQLQILDSDNSYLPGDTMRVLISFERIGVDALVVQDNDLVYDSVPPIPRGNAADGSREIEIPIRSDAPNGVYTLRVVAGTAIGTLQFVIDAGVGSGITASYEIEPANPRPNEPFTVTFRLSESSSIPEKFEVHMAANLMEEVTLEPGATEGSVQATMPDGVRYRTVNVRWEGTWSTGSIHEFFVSEAGDAITRRWKGSSDQGGLLGDVTLQAFRMPDPDGPFRSTNGRRGFFHIRYAPQDGAVGEGEAPFGALVVDVDTTIGLYRFSVRSLTPEGERLRGVLSAAFPADANAFEDYNFMFEELAP